MAKSKRQDAALIAWTDEGELDRFVQKMKKAGFNDVTRDKVRELAKEFNGSAQKVEQAIKSED